MRAIPPQRLALERDCALCLASFSWVRGMIQLADSMNEPFAKYQTMSSPRTKVVLTVDTEASIAGALRSDDDYSPLLDEPVAGEVDGKSEALGFVLETLVNYGFVATFFVETAQTKFFPASRMGQYVELLMRAAQDVQLHLHPCWLSFRNGKLDRSSIVTDRCDLLEMEELVPLIEEGSEILQSWTGVRPTAMRTGNFATSLSVFEAMRRAGLQYASNICIAVHRPSDPQLAVSGGVHQFAGIRELPTTCFADIGPVGRGCYRPMSITALSAREQMTLLTAAHSCKNAVVVILTHPFEFTKRRDFRYKRLRANRLVQRRFRQLCAFLAANQDKFEVTPLSKAAYQLSGSETWTDLRGRWTHSLVRAGQNFLNDHLTFL
jgi:peptidoglycan/xylan/chitin deacetylase (PgdA/CDA1 family)